MVYFYSTRPYFCVRCDRMLNQSHLDEKTMVTICGTCFPEEVDEHGLITKFIIPRVLHDIDLSIGYEKVR